MNVEYLGERLFSVNLCRWRGKFYTLIRSCCKDVKHSIGIAIICSSSL